jgi:hypothetical protein
VAVTRLRPFKGSRFKVQGSRFRVRGSGFKVQGSRFKVQGSALDVGCWMLDVGCWMLDVGCFLRPFLHSAFFLLHLLSPPAGENSRQLAQFAANRGPAPARSLFQPLSFQDFSFSPGPPRRAQDQFQSPVRPEECDARRLGVEEFIKTGMSRPGLLRLLSGDKGIQTLGNSQGMTARPCRR